MVTSEVSNIYTKADYKGQASLKKFGIVSTWTLKIKLEVNRQHCNKGCTLADYYDISASMSVDLNQP